MLLGSDDTDGVTLGTLLGDADGCDVGCPLGNALGVADGADVGFALHLLGPYTKAACPYVKGEAGTDAFLHVLFKLEATFHSSEKLANVDSSSDLYALSILLMSAEVRPNGNETQCEISHSVGGLVGDADGEELGCDVGCALGALLGSVDIDGSLLGVSLGAGVGVPHSSPPGCLPPMTSKGPILVPTYRGVEQDMWIFISQVLSGHATTHVVSVSNRGLRPAEPVPCASNVIVLPSAYQSKSGVCSTRSA